jgi:hypothetical protein
MESPYAGLSHLFVTLERDLECHRALAILWHREAIPATTQWGGLLSKFGNTVDEFVCRR